MSKPLAILLNGLLAYQPASLTPLAPLGSLLEKHGYEVCITNHFNTGCAGREPVLIIGHSQGGASALELAQRYPAARVVTFDAVRMPRCASRSGCLNFRTPGYPRVPGALNIDLDLSFTHIGLPLSPTLQQRTIAYALHSPRPRQEAQNPRRAQTTTLRGRKVLSPDHPPIDRETSTSFLWDRWPNEAFAELEVTIETLCENVTLWSCQ